MPRWPDSESVWQQCIASAVRKHGDDASDHYHIAVDALLKGYTAFSSMTRYGLAAEAGILLARAGNIESALAITENQLRNTPAKWDAARVYAAAVAMLAHDDPAQAYAIVRRAARDAEPRSV
ncbi:MAG: hypothetical protein KGL97_06195, partial [Alphaproteobacteria bacterium]|nr:hypothetical protein [Alphaproteobacteria bacterium]